MAADPLLIQGGNNTGQQSDGPSDKIKHRRTSGEPLGSRSYLDFPEVHWFADELVVFGQLFARGELNEDFAQLSTNSREEDAGSLVCTNQ